MFFLQIDRSRVRSEAESEGNLDKTEVANVGVKIC